MKDAEIEEQFRLLQQEIGLAGEAIAALQRDQRAENDALRLDIAVLKRCLLQLHPAFATHFEAVRATVIRDIDPEASQDSITH